MERCNGLVVDSHPHRSRMPDAGRRRDVRIADRVSARLWRRSRVHPRLSQGDGHQPDRLQDAEAAAAGSARQFSSNHGPPTGADTTFVYHCMSAGYDPRLDQRGRARRSRDPSHPLPASAFCRHSPSRRVTMPVTGSRSAEHAQWSRLPSCAVGASAMGCTPSAPPSPCGSAMRASARSSGNS